MFATPPTMAGAGSGRPRRNAPQIGSRLGGMILVLGLLSVATAAPALAQEISATVDRTEVSLGETVTLTVAATGSDIRGIRPPASDDFAIVGRSTASEFRFGPGGAEQVLRATYTLRPTQEGTLQIGPIVVDTQSGPRHSDPITIRVTGAGGGAAQPPGARGSTPPPAAPQNRAQNPIRSARPGSPANRPPSSSAEAPPPGSDEMYSGPIPSHAAGESFVVAQISDPTPYAGEQVVVDYLLYRPSFDHGLQGRSLSEPEFRGFWFRDITETRAPRRRAHIGTQMINGQVYDVRVLRSFVVVPQRAEETVIPTIRFEGVRTSLLRQGQQQVLESQPLRLQVREPPEAGRPADFVPGNVGKLEFSATAEPQRVRVGDAVVLTLRAEGVALTWQLTLPSLGDLPNARVMEPRESEDVEAAGNGRLRGFKSKTMSIVPLEEGTLVIPSLRFSYFDPFEERYETIETDRIAIEVTGTNPGFDPTAFDEEPEQAEWLTELPAERPIAPTDAPRGTPIPVWLYVLLVAAPPAAWFGWVATERFHRHRVETADVRRERSAAPTAKATLQRIKRGGDSDVADVERALREYVGATTGKPATGLTLDALRPLVEEIATSDVAARVVAVIERAQAHRYGGAADTVDEIVGEARSLIDEMEAHRD